MISTDVRKTMAQLELDACELQVRVRVCATDRRACRPCCVRDADYFLVWQSILSYTGRAGRSNQHTNPDCLRPSALGRTGAVEEQAVDLYGLSPQERLAFFINIYHALTIQAHLELGEPGNLLRLRSYMTAGTVPGLGVADACLLADGRCRAAIRGGRGVSGHHSLVRSGWAAVLADGSRAQRAPKRHESAPIVLVCLPYPAIRQNGAACCSVRSLSRRACCRSKSCGCITTPDCCGAGWVQDPRRALALTDAEPRLNFVLGCGTVSSPEFVWVFDPDQVDEQLDLASEQFLQSQVAVSLASKTYVGALPTVVSGAFSAGCVTVRSRCFRTIRSRRPLRNVRVTLPRVCEWYAADLGASKLEVLRLVLKYLGPKQAVDVQTLLRGKSVKLKYTDYDWAFRGFQPFNAKPVA